MLILVEILLNKIFSTQVRETIFLRQLFFSVKPLSLTPPPPKKCSPLWKSTVCSLMWGSKGIYGIDLICKLNKPLKCVYLKLAGHMHDKATRPGPLRCQTGRLSHDVIVQVVCNMEHQCLLHIIYPLNWHSIPSPSRNILPKLQTPWTGKNKLKWLWYGVCFQERRMTETTLSGSTVLLIYS